MAVRDSSILMYSGGYMCVWMSTTGEADDDIMEESCDEILALRKDGVEKRAVMLRFRSLRCYS